MNELCLFVKTEENKALMLYIKMIGFICYSITIIKAGRNATFTRNFVNFSVHFILYEKTKIAIC